MHSLAQTNRINVKENLTSPSCDRGAQVKDVNGSSSKLRTLLVKKSSKSPIITIHLDKSTKDLSRAQCSNASNPITTQENIQSTTTTFPVSITGSHSMPAVDSTTPPKVIPPLRMPVPTYCIPHLQPTPSRYGHSVFSPYRQRVVIRPLQGDPNCMFRYVPAFNTFPISMSKTGTSDSASNSSATFDSIFQQNGYGKSDKAVQTAENRWEEYKKLEYDIARQRKLISQLMKIIVKDKLEREKLDEKKRTSEDTTEALTNSILSSSSREYLASLMKPALLEVASSGDLCNSKKPVESGRRKVFVSRDDPSVQYRGSASSSSSGLPNAKTKQVVTGKSSDQLVVQETSKKKNENEDVKECDSNDELIERGRRALELLSSGSYTLNRPPMQPYLSVESPETNKRKNNDSKHDNVVSVPQKVATTEEYFLIEENCPMNDVSDKSSQGSGKTKIDEPFVVTDSSEQTVTATVPRVNGVSNTEPKSDDVGATNKSKKTVASVLPKDRNRKKRRLSSKKKFSSEEESNSDEKMGNRRSPRKRLKPSNTNEYIRRSASKQATKKIYDILKGSESDPSPPTKSTDCSNQVKKKTRRKLLPPKIVPIDDIIDANYSENRCDDPVIIKVEPTDEVHDADSHSHAKVTSMPSHTTNNSYIQTTEDVSNEFEHLTPGVQPNSKVPHNPNDPKHIDSKTSESQPFFILPELTVKIEKLDDQTSLLLCNTEQEQSEALDLRITKPLENLTIPVPKASECRCEQLVPPIGSEHNCHVPFRPHFPASSTLRRTGGLVPSFMGQSLSNMHGVRSDIVFAPFVSACQKRPNQDEPTSGNQNLGMWLRKRAPRTASQAKIGRKSKSAPSAGKSSKQVNKVKAKYRKKSCELVASGTGKKKRGRKKRQQTAKERVCRKVTKIPNSEGNDDSSDYALLEEKTKKLKKRREYRNSNLCKATKSSSKQSEFLSVNEFPYVALSNNTSESSEIEPVDNTPYQSNNKPVTTTGISISDSYKMSPTQQADYGVASQHSTSDKNHDERIFDDLPIPANTISELELAIEKMKEQIERVSREREQRLLSELSSSEFERSNEFLTSEMVKSISNEGDDAGEPLKDVVKVEKDDRGSCHTSPYTEILADIPFENGALAELVGIDKDSQGQSNEFSPDKSNKCDVRTDEGAASRVVDDVAEWTMTPRKACREAKEKITRLAHQPTKQRKPSRTKSGYS